MVRTRYTLGEACAALGGIESKTLARWVDRYNQSHTAEERITVGGDPHDLRQRWLSADALARLAADRDRDLVALADDLPHTLQEALAMIDQLKGRIADLEKLATMRNSAMTRYEPNLTARPPEQDDSSSHAPRRARITPQRDASNLPYGAAIFRTYAERHGIPGMTATAALDRGDLEATRGTWRVGRNDVRTILTQEQQRAFLAWARRHQRYQRCEVGECACHEHDEAPAE